MKNGLLVLQASTPHLALTMSGAVSMLLETQGSLSCLALPCLVLPYLALPCLTLPCLGLALPYTGFGVSSLPAHLTCVNKLAIYGALIHQAV